MIPLIKYPNTSERIPSSGRVVTVRRMLAAEEKKILMARESNDSVEIVRAVREVVSDCLGNDDHDLTTFDVDYLFVKILASSVNNVIERTYRDNEDGETRTFTIDLSDVRCSIPSFEPTRVVLSDVDETTLVLGWPPASLLTDSEFVASKGEIVARILVSECMRSIERKGSATDVSAAPREEKMSWLETLKVSDWNAVRDHLASIPTIKYEIKYENSKGTPRSIVLSGLQDFFELR